MLFLRRFLFGLMAVLPAVVLPAYGAAQARSNLRFPLVPLQVAESTPQPSIEAELHAMSVQAGVIFAGEVLAIRPQGDAGTGWVDVEFRVEDAIRGCGADGTYLLREWAGLWTGGVQRYRVGEHLLMLLHTPSAMGLSSPVGGQDGAIPITGSSVAPGPKDDFAEIGEQAVDLRWIEARLLRTSSSPHVISLHGRPVAPTQPVHVEKNAALVAHKSAMSEVQRVDEAPTAFETAVGVNDAQSPVQGLTLRTVLAMLGAWEAQSAYVVH